MKPAKHQSRLPWGGLTDLPDEKQIYRAVLYKRWIRDGIKPGAFIRRASDTDGISVNDPDSCSPKELCATFSACFGVLQLAVGDVRSVGPNLDVKPDTDEALLCDHANIIGLPPYDSQDDSLSEYFGGLLAEKARYLPLD